MATRQLPANQNLTLSSGTGAFSQTYANTTGTAATFGVTNTATSGTTTVKGIGINLAGHQQWHRKQHNNRK